MKLDRSTTASRNPRQLAAVCGELRTKKREENLPFLPPLFFFPLNPFIISPPIIPQKKRKEKNKKRECGRVPRALGEKKIPTGGERVPAGAPRKWKSVSAMQKAIDAYFENCEGEPLIVDGVAVTDKYGMPVIVGAKPPTITGLALALGLNTRKALLDYQARPEFMNTVTRAKARCEEYAEMRLYDKDGANGAKFSLGCNFGWNAESEKSGDPAALAALILALKGGNDAN